MTRRNSRWSLVAIAVAMVALVAALGGTAMAKPGDVDTKDLENGAVTAKKIAKGAVGNKQIKAGAIKGDRLKDGAVSAAKIADGVLTAAKIANGAVTAAKIADATITGKQVAPEGISSENISDYAVLSSEAGSFVKLTATEAATAAAARTAAPETTLFTKGQITITAKCFRDTGADETFAEMYVKTSADGAIFDGATDAREGGNAATDFLNDDTLETDRVLDDANAIGADATLDEAEFTIVGADGTHLLGQNTVAAKNGELAGGNGVYGTGNVCLYGAEISG